ncbi:O-antigen ligase family protein [Franzmannia qiaohouensis]|uniref:O-antigen ligase family protein n=1 Tax=Franzmannia qiaohouensis TaxID=1329370 RepID=A0ABU1HL40_9GAMM|nr:O-antigen ligase family protein [Halomonas qiaohouensis]MDR5907484.1 O-antigen ligase family protein [Halomonas qiaohouensis]
MAQALPVSPGSGMRIYTSMAAFLLMAIALVVPSGYSLGAVMLLLGSVVLLGKRGQLTLRRADLAIMAVFAAYALVVIAEAWWDGQGSRGMDRPARFLLAIPALLLVLAFPPRAGAIWAGLATGGILAGGWAGWQKLIEGVERASGYTYVIQFGNISMLSAILCAAGLGWALVQPRARLWVALLALGIAGGVLGSLFSGTRGGWVGIPVVLWVLYRGYGRDLPGKWKSLALVAVLVVGTMAYAIPQTGVQSRVGQAVNDIQRYVNQENRTSSVGARFEMWKGAAHLIAEKPLLGWGENGYQLGMQQMADDDVIHPFITTFDHAHNEFIDATAKRGLLGLAVLLALYLVPMRLFARQLAAPDMQLRAFAVAGVLLPVAYFDFGLTQVFLAHNSGVMVYAFLLPVLWAGFRARERQLAS